MTKSRGTAKITLNSYSLRSVNMFLSNVTVTYVRSCDSVSAGMISGREVMTYVKHPN